MVAPRRSLLPAASSATRRRCRSQRQRRAAARRPRPAWIGLAPLRASDCTPGGHVDEHAQDAVQLPLVRLLDDEPGLHRREEVAVDLLGHRDRAASGTSSFTRRPSARASCSASRRTPATLPQLTSAERRVGVAVDDEEVAPALQRLRACGSASRSCARASRRSRSGAPCSLCSMPAPGSCRPACPGG